MNDTWEKETKDFLNATFSFGTEKLQRMEGTWIKALGFCRFP
ncbi:hypothetical protein C5S32_04895 [ANME-1 cluster archaeon GoMg1]|nr:hypothetical protein [ANME-1 cluster archaeon GoMg1]